MDNNQQALSRIIEIINKGRSGVIIIPPAPTLDAIAASTALYLVLTKWEKMSLSPVLKNRPAT